MNIQPDNLNAFTMTTYNRNRFNHILLASIGIFGADECNNRHGNIAGIAFKSTSFSAMYNK
jgi:hypothetical protein